MIWCDVLCCAQVATTNWQFECLAFNAYSMVMTENDITVSSLRCRRKSSSTVTETSREYDNSEQQISSETRKIIPSSSDRCSQWHVLNWWFIGTSSGLFVMIILSWRYAAYINELHENDLWFLHIKVRFIYLFSCSCFTTFDIAHSCWLLLGLGDTCVCIPSSDSVLVFSQSCLLWSRTSECEVVLS